MSIKYIIVAALKSETPTLEELAPVVHTGVGKLNAAIKLTQAIQHYKPDLVINYGTAGSLNDKSGLLRIDQFVQWDMDVRPLGFSRGVTPYEEVSQLTTDEAGVTLASGDSFVTNATVQLDGLNVYVDLVDMEAFALKTVCEAYDVAFVSYKYVTDNADSDSSGDWINNVANGADLIRELLAGEYGRSGL